MSSIWSTSVQSIAAVIPDSTRTLAIELILSPVKLIAMSCYGPKALSKLASVVEDVCKALEGSGHLSVERKQAFAKRIIELYENGITDPDELRLGMMADGPWASQPPHERAA